MKMNSINLLGCVKIHIGAFTHAVGRKNLSASAAKKLLFKQTVW